MSTGKKKSKPPGPRKAGYWKEYMKNRREGKKTALLDEKLADAVMKIPMEGKKSLSERIAVLLAEIPEVKSLM